MMAAIATVIRNKREPGRPVPPGITCLSLSWLRLSSSSRSGCSGGRPFPLPPPLLKGMILFFRWVGSGRLALIKHEFAWHCRLIVDFERLAREHFGRKLFDGVPIASAAWAKCRYRNRREQLCRCRIVEGGHEATIALFGNVYDSISEIQPLIGEVAEHLRTGTSTDTRKGCRGAGEDRRTGLDFGPHGQGRATVVLVNHDLWFTWT